MAKSANLHLGTSSFSEKSWEGVFYPPKTKPGDYLAHYATQFDTVEIDATYYAIPAARTVQGWHDKTPKNFIFAAKFPRSIVHCGEGAKPRGDLVLTPDATYQERDSFLKVMALLGKKLGPLLIQFPYFNKDAFGNRHQFLERLAPFLSDLPKEFRYALEIRNKAWIKQDLIDLLAVNNIAFTLVDQAWMPHGDEVFEMVDPITTDFAYIRLIGDRNEIEAITETWDKIVIDRSENLMRWATVIEKIMQSDIDAFAYINNHFAGHAPATLRQLQKLLKK